jgi:hypothetical protein
MNRARDGACIFRYINTYGCSVFVQPLFSRAPLMFSRSPKTLRADTVQVIACTNVSAPNKE